MGIVERVMGTEVEPVWGSMPDRAWDTIAWVADSRKIRDELGWEPRFDLEQGFGRC